MLAVAWHVNNFSSCSVTQEGNELRMLRVSARNIDGQKTEAEIGVKSKNNKIIMDKSECDTNTARVTGKDTEISSLVVCSLIVVFRVCGL